ncbi:MAG: hypothetical protein RBS78_00945 [Coriobacteriia bacterium]|nr:hypothetical protein [Coriobacteriia bacterium]
MTSFLNQEAMVNDFNVNRRYGEEATKPAADLLTLRKQLDAMLKTGEPKPDALGQPVNTVRDVLEVLKRFYRAGTAGGGGGGGGGAVASVNGRTGTIVLSGADIPTVGPSTVQGEYRMPFASPVALTAGTPYVLAVSITTGTGTTPVRPITNSGGPLWRIFAPLSILHRIVRWDSIAPTESSGATPSSVTPGNGVYAIHPEGFFTT